MIKDTHNFFEGLTSPETTIMAVNRKAESLLLEVDGITSGNIIIQGKVNTEQEYYTDLALIDMANFSVHSSISANGKYTVGVAGFTNIKIDVKSVSGALNLYGTEF